MPEYRWSWVSFVTGFLMTAVLFLLIPSAPQTRAEGVDFGPPARSFEELKRERERFGPRGDRNPMLKPGEHPDDPRPDPQPQPVSPLDPQPPRAEIVVTPSTSMYYEILHWQDYGPVFREHGPFADDKRLVRYRSPQRPRVLEHGVLKFIWNGRETLLSGSWRVCDPLTVAERASLNGATVGPDPPALPPRVEGDL
jgi:hypothetical protein